MNVALAVCRLLRAGWERALRAEDNDPLSEPAVTISWNASAFAVWEDDRSYAIVSTPYRCVECGHAGVPSLRDGAVCLRCGAEQGDSFREGWDESD